ncbi:concanavalin A-like lectin/glucanase domain-containing protein [Podospora fimiseda]|uniref:Concanavalin A-like lectin/glucanase domain-containing protein n=1 Tax=Podospora fimiseda TaxID=252190 RepID=A0AAN7BPQ3_9PEZI|nr:concanavalin A-like lectin/glucanase domain-containing protein [Podospora fimiseda]
MKDQYYGSKLKWVNVTRPAYAARADFCIPRDCGEYFFETEVLAGGEVCSVAVGFGWFTSDVGMNGRWESGIWGYHGDDGMVRYGVHEEKYGELFHVGDIIGCGYIKRKGIIYFTKNRKYLGVPFEGVRGQLYPMVSLTNPGSKIKCRFDAPIPDKVITHSPNGETSTSAREDGEPVEQQSKG